MSEITSSTEICNLALQRIGERTITSLDQDDEVARRCKIAYPQSRDALLRMHPWNFAIKRATLAADTATPDWEYAYQHTLPSDCLRLIRTQTETWATRDEAARLAFPYTSPDYRVEGRKIVSDEETQKIEYIYRNEDISQYDDLFIDALIARLSAELAAASKKNVSGVQGLWKTAEVKLNEAMHADSLEGITRNFETHQFLQARF